MLSVEITAGTSKIFVAHRQGHRAANMEKIEFGAEKLPGYIAGPVGAPGVICLQEAWGVTDEMKEFSIKIASKGYRVLLPDLYKGKIGLEMEEVMHLYKNFDFPKGVQEIGEAAKYLREHGSAKVGVVGFCMGGGLALAAAQSAGVDCAVPFYGMPPVELCQPETLKVPIQGHFGELDHSPVANKEAALALDAKLKTCPAAAHCEVFIYEGEGHAFMNPSTETVLKQREMFNLPTPKADSQELAWGRLFDFFGKHLRA